MRATAEANVRVHLRFVSRMGHNQAVSMCAWPMATERCRTASPKSSAIAGAIIRWAAATSGIRSSVCGEDPLEASSARVVETHRAHHTVEHLDVVGERFGLRVDDHERGLTEAVQRTVTGGVERAELRRRVRREHRVRRRLEVEDERTGDSLDRVVGPARMDALERPEGAVVGNVDDEAFALEAGGLGWKPRSMTASTRRPAHSGGISPDSRNHVVAHGAPH